MNAVFKFALYCVLCKQDLNGSLFYCISQHVCILVAGASDESKFKSNLGEQHTVVHLIFSSTSYYFTVWLLQHNGCSQQEDANSQLFAAVTD